MSTLAECIARYQETQAQPDRRSVTLTPLGEAVALARRTGRAVAALTTAEERVTVLGTVASTALATIRADDSLTVA
jgi:hypothetical protein